MYSSDRKGRTYRGAGYMLKTLITSELLRSSGDVEGVLVINTVNVILFIATIYKSQDVSPQEVTG